MKTWARETRDAQNLPRQPEVSLGVGRWVLPRKILVGTFFLTPKNWRLNDETKMMSQFFKWMGKKPPSIDHVKGIILVQVELLTLSAMLPGKQFFFRVLLHIHVV